MGLIIRHLHFISGPASCWTISGTSHHYLWGFHCQAAYFLFGALLLSVGKGAIHRIFILMFCELTTVIWCACTCSWPAGEVGFSSSRKPLYARIKIKDNETYPTDSGFAGVSRRDTPSSKPRRGLRVGYYVYMRLQQPFNQLPLRHWLAVAASPMPISEILRIAEASATSCE